MPLLKTRLLFFLHPVLCSKSLWSDGLLLKQVSSGLRKLLPLLLVRKLLRLTLEGYGACCLNASCLWRRNRHLSCISDQIRARHHAALTKRLARVIVYYFLYVYTVKTVDLNDGWWHDFLLVFVHILASFILKKNLLKRSVTKRAGEKNAGTVKGFFAHSKLQKASLSISYGILLPEDYVGVVIFL